ncbi:MAG: SDR family oxidoreductase [Bacteroidetes bacterium]|nr:MAG: SDR family oxidoreductase [Bacteroidota bacterium]
MRIVVLGGAGFIGKKLVSKLLKRGQISLNGRPVMPINQLVVFDKEKAIGLPEDSRLEIVEGDICNRGTIAELLGKHTDVIFHLAAVVSGEAEKNFELGMQVNLQANLQLLEICRAMYHAPVLVFASSVAVYGGELTEIISDDTAPIPQSSYGTQKAMMDLLINDYSRRGFIDGRALRLPTIAIRSGKPNAATSSFVSSIIREPLQGQRANCPVTPDIKVWILSPEKVTDNFIHAAHIPAQALKNNRVVNLPGLTVTVREMVSTLETVAGSETTKLIDWEPDAFIQSIVLTWPPQFVTERALTLGFQRDASVEGIIKSFIKEELT